MMTIIDIARKIAFAFSELPIVSAVALGGSQSFGNAEAGSDIDLYVYSLQDIPAAVRVALIDRLADEKEIDNRFWEPGDEWRDKESGILIDVMYRQQEWITEQLERVLKRHEASVGYSTCFWHNVLTSKILFDREGWFKRLQTSVKIPYPNPLQQAIIAKNYPILRKTKSAYIRQIEKAISRQDWISVNHRGAALLASYFDILFAINKLPHPGEKRLLKIAEKHCKKLPENMTAQIDDVFKSMESPANLLAKINALLDEFDHFLMQEGVRHDAF